MVLEAMVLEADGLDNKILAEIDVKAMLEDIFDLEEEILKVMVMGTALGFDFKDKEVMAEEVISKAISKLKGGGKKMEKFQ
ncbi:hypothetical protein Q3G72_007304 [Acer saccharum]|nr:hypothetical protein Q3G72_007304 [Acer saccharum]